MIQGYGLKILNQSVFTRMEMYRFYVPLIGLGFKWFYYILPTSNDERNGNESLDDFKFIPAKFDEPLVTHFT